MKKATVTIMVFMLLSCAAALMSGTSLPKSEDKSKDCSRLDNLFQMLRYQRVRYENKVTQLQWEVKRCYRNKQ